MWHDGTATRQELALRSAVVFDTPTRLGAYRVSGAGPAFNEGRDAPRGVDDEAVAFAELGLHRVPAHLEGAKRVGVGIALVAHHGFGQLGRLPRFGRQYEIALFSMARVGQSESDSGN